MTDDASVHLRDVLASDLPIFYEHQLDPEACAMAAFAPRERESFMAHWNTKILGAHGVIARTIVVDGAVAGHAVCFMHTGRRMIGYWLGRQFWGNGIATKSLAAFVAETDVRPLDAYVAKRNLGSIRVLEKCGFARAGESVGADGVEEYLYTLAA